MSDARDAILYVARRHCLSACVTQAAKRENWSICQIATYWIGPQLRQLQPRIVLLEPDGWNVPARSVVMAVVVLVQALSQARLLLHSRLPAAEVAALSSEFALPKSCEIGDEHLQKIFLMIDETNATAAFGGEV